jgi:hypothetical protein
MIPMPQFIAPFIMALFIIFHMADRPPGVFWEAPRPHASAPFRQPAGLLLAKVGKRAIHAIPAGGIGPVSWQASHSASVGFERYALTGTAAAPLTQCRTNPGCSFSKWRECLQALIWIKFGKKNPRQGGYRGLPLARMKAAIPAP